MDPQPALFAGKTGIERVRAIRDYIKSDASSWERKGGIRMMWNGADEAAHNGAKSACTVNSKKRKRQDGAEEENAGEGPDDDMQGSEPADCGPEVENPTSTAPVSSSTPIPSATPEPEPEPEPVHKAGCSLSTDGLLGGAFFTVWGAYWDGRPLEELAVTDDIPGDMKFKIGDDAGDDGRQWTATFVSEKKASEVTDFIKEKAGEGAEVKAC
jgi:hypothetical protein